MPVLSVTKPASSAKHEEVSAGVGGTTLDVTEEDDDRSVAVVAGSKDAFEEDSGPELGFTEDSAAMLDARRPVEAPTLELAPMLVSTTAEDSGVGYVVKTSVTVMGMVVVRPSLETVSIFVIVVVTRDGLGALPDPITTCSNQFESTRLACTLEEVGIGKCLTALSRQYIPFVTYTIRAVILLEFSFVTADSVLLKSVSSYKVRQESRLT